jgi:flavin reductase (DIM6/NTAB) family NADH-FMN oxidoreductase RutF
MKEISPEKASMLAAPWPYALVSSLDMNGRPNALGVSWVTRVSIEPFLILISIAPERYSHDGIALHKEFVVNYPSAEQSKGAWICGSESGRKGDKLKKAGLTTVPSKKVKTPTISGSTVAFECKVVQQVTSGDHTLFVGEVVEATGDESRTKHLFAASDWSLFPMGGKGTL